MKRAVSAAAVLLLVLCVLTFSSAAENLVANGSFELFSSVDRPEQWHSSAYRNQAGYSRMTITNEKAHSGTYSALIENTSSNDSRFITTVSVKPETMYKLSGYVCVDYMEDIGNGANLAIEGIYSFSDGVFDTNGEWKYLEWYGETGEGQKELTFGVRVGGYSAESVGKAYFDDIMLEEVETLPDGIIASLWYDASNGHQNNMQQSTDSSSKTFLWVIIGAVFAFIFCWSSTKIQTLSAQKENILLWILLFIGLVLRIILGVSIPGYEVDINCFASWSMRMADVGPSGFYSPDYFCDYPPGAMLLLWPVGFILTLIGYGHPYSLLVLKTLPILCDLAGRYCSINLPKSMPMGRSAVLPLLSIYLIPLYWSTVRRGGKWIQCLLY